jgi:hypothetical protein
MGSSPSFIAKKEESDNEQRYKKDGFIHHIWQQGINLFLKLLLF